jgi:hypothetical protein
MIRQRPVWSKICQIQVYVYLRFFRSTVYVYFTIYDFKATYTGIFEVYVFIMGFGGLRFFTFFFT